MISSFHKERLEFEQLSKEKNEYHVQENEEESQVPKQSGSQKSVEKDCH